LTLALFLQNLINALQWGSFYALIALGYSMVYGVLLLINFAHGDIFMVGAYFGFFISAFLLGAYALKLPYALSPEMIFFLTLLLTMALTAGVGVTIERIAYRPLRRKGANRLYVVITALMVGLILENGNLALLGASRKSFPELIPRVFTTGGRSPSATSRSSSSPPPCWSSYFFRSWSAGPAGGWLCGPFPMTGWRSR